MMTLAIRQRKNTDGWPKPGELIEIKGADELTLQSRRVFNVLLENAWPRLEDTDRHEIPLKQLRGSHKGSERVADSLQQLRTMQVRIPSLLKGRPSYEEVGLIVWTNRHIDEDHDDAVVQYEFHPRVREIIASSTTWGRIKGFVCFAFSSKYALALYELICLRKNRQSTEEYFNDTEFRDLLGVKPNTYKAYPQLRQRVLEPAQLEVNKLSDVSVSITVVREGGFQRGKVIGYRIQWDKKDVKEWREVLDELGRSKIGRRARITGTVDYISTELAG